MVGNVQDFVQSFFDVVDNFGCVLEIVWKFVFVDDVEINVKLLVLLFEGVEMIDKQFMKVCVCV